ncbi:hypothetical protein IE4872_CH00508 [Rhizobium gallicum]|uniref:Uncharacterized protein n=1 Tax=Rhizobium gallicum TaxID=56730 RepID=A0A1L5NE56_9HYPH|nr:hypothetical protein IE4872_CH00508 [Rhizobium gallicum]
MDCHRAVTTSLFWFICWLLDPGLGKRLTTSVEAWRLLEGGGIRPQRSRWPPFLLFRISATNGADIRDH